MDNINLKDLSNLDLSALDNLSPAEKELAFSILKEYSKDGTSKKLNDLLLEDYSETPVDILTFVDDYNYLGNAWHDAEGKSKLYPYWRKELLKIFPDNLTTTVNNGIFSGSRGRGKAQPLDALLYSESGYIKMRDIQIGTNLYGSDGKLHKVLGIFPQGRKPVYKISFSDGTSTLCSDEHLWTVVDENNNSKTLSLKILKDLLKFESLRIPLLAKPIIDPVIAFNVIKDSSSTADQLAFNIQALGGTYNIETKEICLSKHLSKQLNIRYKEPVRYITNIEYIEDQECQCIYIDAEDHLYLTNDLILTHNTEIAVLIAAYLLHRILCLKDPVAFFHLKPTEKLVFAFMNIKLALAEEIGITKFQNTIQSSPWFMQNGTLEGRTKKIWVPKKFKDQEAVDIKIGSQSDDLIGLPIYYCFMDEVSFQRNKSIEEQKKKAYDLINTAIGGMKTRFVHKGKNPTFLALASSKRSNKSFLEEYIKKKLESEKTNVYISDGPVWEVKPKGTYSDQTFRIALGNKFLQSVVIPDDEDSNSYIAKGYKIIEAPIDFKADFLDDIDRALCDFAGISSSNISKYISAQAFYELITSRIHNPFSRDTLEIGNAPDDDAQYYDFFDITKIDPALRSKPLFIHLDMSVSGDKTGIAGVFIKGKKPSTNIDFASNDLFYSLAFSISIKAPKGRQVSFEKNRNFIRWLKRQGFNIKGVTSDTYQAYDLQQQLLSEGYPCSIISVDRVDTDRICKPYQYFKSTIYEKRLEIYEDTLLNTEVTELERNIDTGKVDHPEAGSKDKADAVCGAIFNASKHAEEYAYDYGESAEELLRLNSDNYIADTQKLNFDFEEELKKMSGIMQPSSFHPSDISNNKISQYSMYNDIIIL